MSYILPITHFQYNDYQRRTIHEKGNKHFIESPFKVILEKEHQEISAKYDAFNRGNMRQYDARGVAGDLFGELTGKGMHINNYI
ncbi:hypothetical protein NSQ77_03095 [Oceanobacillus sp. FSL K6-2867]|uniref:hypothetical protein n=1 Tax=Oceanobacillus sp. FSL K6-2867 TaxID=2954748 RepID=UPI0030D6F5E9